MLYTQLSTSSGSMWFLLPRVMSIFKHLVFMFRWVMLSGPVIVSKNSLGSVTVFIQAQMLIVFFPFVGDTKQSRRWWFWPTVFSVWNVNGPASPPHWWFWETSAFNQLCPLLKIQFIDTIFLDSLFSLLMEMSSLYASWRFFFHLC